MTPAQLIKARKSLGLSQAGLAEALDMSIRSISGMETGSRPISRVVELAVKALGQKGSAKPSMPPWGKQHE